VNKFVLNLITEWRRLELPFAGETIVVAVSGGADSLALLLALDELRERKKLDLRIVAAHFNHKLRGRESDADEDFVKDLAAERSFELAVGHGNIPKEGNLEQNARNARYEFLLSTAKNLNAGHVLTAHTMNDQAETFLLNLIRGSGLDGLAGMRTVREFRSGGVVENEGETAQLVLPLQQSSRIDSETPSLPHSSTPPLLTRPLLRWAKREDTENYCREMGVEFRYDTMNEDMSFKRVRVRKMLLPMLKEFNPKIVETLAKTAELMAEQLGTPSPTGPDDGRQMPKELSIQELSRLEPPQLRQTLRSWLGQHRGGLRSVGLKHIRAIEQLAFSTKSGRVAELPGFGRVRRSNGRLSFENIKVDK
jgi:tRNA(Ile)-lysidine synthase